MKTVHGSLAGFNRPRVIIIIVVAGLLLPLFFFLSSPNKETIKFGVMIPLSGPALQQTVVADTVRPATEEVNAPGDINARKMELVISRGITYRAAL